MIQIYQNKGVNGITIIFEGKDITFPTLINEWHEGYEAGPLMYVDVLPTFANFWNWEGGRREGEKRGMG